MPIALPNSKIILNFYDEYKAWDTIGQKVQGTDSRTEEMRNVY